MASVHPGFRTIQVNPVVRCAADKFPVSEDFQYRE
jgi:hypothetical protein